MLKAITFYLPFFTGLLAGIWFFNLNITVPHWAHLPGDLADSRFINYLLEHAHQYLCGNTGSFWDAPFLYPEAQVITYSDNMLGTAPFYSIFRLLGFEKESAFQCWFIVISALNYISCYLLLDYTFKNRYAAALGAMIFAFSLALQSQMVHAQTFPRFAVPLVLLTGSMYLKELKPGYFFGMLFFLVYQFYCGLYLGFMLFVVTALFLACSIVFRWNVYREQVKKPKWLLRMFASLIANLALLLPLVLPYLNRAQQLRPYPYNEVVQTVPTLKSYFYSHYESLFWEFLNKTGVNYEAFWDHQIFAGGVATLCFCGFMVFMLFKLAGVKAVSGIPVNKTLYLFFFTALITFLLFTRFQGYSLYQLVYPIPGFASMRALQRIVNVELVFYAIAVAFVFTFLFRAEKKHSIWLFIAFGGLIIADNHISSDTTDRYVKEDSRKRVGALIEKIKDLKPGTVFSYEPEVLEGEPAYYQLDAMLAAQACGLKTLNGYTANSPDEYSFYWVKPNAESRLRWLRKKGLSPDSVVVIH